MSINDIFLQLAYLSLNNFINKDYFTNKYEKKVRHQSIKIKQIGHTFIICHIFIQKLYQTHG